MKLGNFSTNASMSSHYLEQAQANSAKALNNISAQRALSGIDSANLAIADSLRSQSSTLEQGVANANDAIGILQIADSTLANITQSADRIGELSVRYSSGILNVDQQKMIKSEVGALTKSMQDSVDQASFNGKNVFGGQMSFLTGNGMESINLSAPKFGGIDVGDINSVHKFIGGVNALRGEIGAAQNGIISGINASLTKNIALKQSESQLQNNDIAKNISAFKQNDLQANAAVLAQAHNTASLQSQFNRLLG
nr:flagellin [uncultured Campylobacter sp.]